MDEEFDIYEDLHLDAILVATVGEDGTVTPVDSTGTELRLFSAIIHICSGVGILEVRPSYGMTSSLIVSQRSTSFLQDEMR